MKYQLYNPSEAEEAFHFLTELVGRGSVVDIKRVNPVRSLSQNSYLHLLLADFAQHFGYTEEEAKTLYKREVNPAIYVYVKNDRKFLRSSADLTKEEMQHSIDRFMEYSSANGYDLPPADSPEHITFAQNQIERNSKYL